jgi:hypothetical protein
LFNGDGDVVEITAAAILAAPGAAAAILAALGLWRGLPERDGVNA